MDQYLLSRLHESGLEINQARDGWFFAYGQERHGGFRSPEEALVMAIRTLLQGGSERVEIDGAAEAELGDLLMEEFPEQADEDYIQAMVIQRTPQGLVEAVLIEPYGEFHIWREADHWHIYPPTLPILRDIPTGSLRRALLHLYNQEEQAQPRRRY